MLRRLAAIVAVSILSIIGVTTAAAGHENSAPLTDRVAVQYTVQQESACGRDPATGVVTCCGQGRAAC